MPPSEPRADPGATLPSDSFLDVPRLFIAVLPPPLVFECLAGLSRDESAGVRWTTPDQWHVTLRYLGKVAEESAHAVFNEIDASPARAVLGPTVERLGREVVVAPVDGLDSLAASVSASIGEFGDAPHPDGFRGHLTLARQRGGGTCSIDSLAIDASFEVEEIVLVRSDLHAEGARYTTVARSRLSP
jgi:2'-5' RNA ligase